MKKPLLVLLSCLGASVGAHAAGFDVTNSTIDGVQAAIMSGETTCVQVVQGYIDRAKAFNGSCVVPVTADGKPTKGGKGTMRAGKPISFSRDTVAVSNVLPNFSEYKGLPIEYGRLEPTASDPSVLAMYGMVVGKPNAGQVSALNTLNIRGERSVTCKGAFDLHPSKGPLPKGAPAVCEEFRKMPDALERAAELDAQYGKSPDLEAMPMYCVAMAFKDAVDTKDMRSTSGADVAYAMDAAPKDATLVERLRSRGAIIYAKANLDEYNGGGGNPGGVKAKSVTFGAGASSTWGGTTCNVYDTAIETGGSSSGSAASVGASLAHCAVCEETGGSCRQPAWRNGVVGLVVTKGLMPYGGAIGGDPYVDRPGLHCRTVADTAKALDAMRDPKGHFFDPRDIYSALPRSIESKTPYASFTKVTGLGDKPLKGVRVGIVREYMVKHTKNDVAVSDAIDAEIKKVLRDQLGAELVETTDPLYPDDPDVPNAAYTFEDALSEILPMHMPEYLAEMKDGKPRFPVEGYGKLDSRDYLVKLVTGQAPLSPEINFRSINSAPRTAAFSLHMAEYLALRNDAKVKDWVSLNANAKYDSEGRAVAAKNWENKTDLVAPGTTFRMKMRDVGRMALMKVMLQNGIDVLVNPTITLPPAKIGHASPPTVRDRPIGRFPTAANLGIPEITVPAGFNQIVYEPQYVLNETKDDYLQVSNETTPGKFDNPMPYGISFWGGPGDEGSILKVAAIYENATHHRVGPPAFGPLAKK
jgi:Asp-tRNA(Asn)/Glu-tRNA(Gln) amidotransferase A subunit family amidase